MTGFHGFFIETDKTVNQAQYTYTGNFNTFRLKYNNEIHKTDQRTFKIQGPYSQTFFLTYEWTK